MTLTEHSTQDCPKHSVSAVTGLQASGLSYATMTGQVLLNDVSFTAGLGTLTAVIGPSGAGKTTLLNLLSTTVPTRGTVWFNGEDIHSQDLALRGRIGMVPQDDVVHRQLTVGRALGFAAELRLPATSDAAERHAAIDLVLAELGLAAHRHQRVDTLSGGQRKRVSVAMELLTSPELLILDEPTTGLDPALDRQVMRLLRRLADAGRVVIVATHSLTYLDLCDQLVLLAPGGRVAFAGSPRDVHAVMGTTDWAEIYTDRITHRTAVAPPPQAPPRPVPTSATPASKCCSRRRQLATIARRQLQLIRADRNYLASLLLLPVILGALALVVPGNNGLGPADPRGTNPNEPSQILVLLTIAAVFMGTTLTIRDLIGERGIFRREQSTGLSTTAYLAAKALIFSALAAIQTAVLTTIVSLGKPAPRLGGLLVHPVLELYLTLALTAIVSALTGLALSAAVRTADQILPMLVLAVMVSIVMCGGLIPVTDRPVLDQASRLLPARWAFAAASSTVDLHSLDSLIPHQDPLWNHAPTTWLTDLGVLSALGIFALCTTHRRLRQIQCDNPGTT